ncbi:MAG TPA: extracellular solute-binding protein [Actinomycetota bacterium]|nr:extracellular solute-binding protein [Actinomycetota bacterium]
MNDARLRIPALLLVLACLLAACNPAGEEDADQGSGDAQESVDPATLEAELTVWGFGTEDVIASSRIEQFEKAYPNVTVKLTPGEFDTQKFLSAVASGDPPDVIHVDRNLIGSFATRGALAPLDDFVSASDLDTGVYYDSAMSQVTVDGQVYGIPQFSNVVVAIINDAALEDAGVAPEDVDFSDWDALADLNAELSKTDGGKVERVGVDVGLPAFTPFWAAVNGGAILSEDGSESMLDSPETIEAVEYAASLREPIGGQEKYEGFSQTWDFFGSKNMFVEDQIGIGLFEQWYLGVLAEVSPDVDVTVAPFTTHDGGETISHAGGLAWAVPEGSGDAQAAFEFMKFMTDADTWVQAAQDSKDDIESKGGIYTGTYTANQEADERIFEEVYEPSGKQALDDAVEVVLDAQAAAVSMPPSGAGEEIIRIYEAAANEVLLGADAQQVFEEADAEAQRALDDAAEG